MCLSANGNAGSDFFQIFRNAAALSLLLTISRSLSLSLSLYVGPAWQRGVGPMAGPFSLVVSSVATNSSNLGANDSMCMLMHKRKCIETELSPSFPFQLDS